MSSLKERRSYKRAIPISTSTEDNCALGLADRPVARPSDVVSGRIVAIGALRHEEFMNTLCSDSVPEITSVGPETKVVPANAGTGPGQGAPVASAPCTAIVAAFAQGLPVVRFQLGGAERSERARSCIPLDAASVGREVVLLFDGNDPSRPIITGIITRPDLIGSAVVEPDTVSRPRTIEVDGERLVLSARREIVIRCGEASIVLTRAGKILIRGTYLLNRSSGVNLIKGGSVQIN
jgi:hypothetical protein